MCYEEYYLSNMIGLNCDHKFCVDCVKEHLSSNIQQGKAIAIRCMEQGCQERYGLD